MTIPNNGNKLLVQFDAYADVALVNMAGKFTFGSGGAWPVVQREEGLSFFASNGGSWYERTPAEWEGLAREILAKPHSWCVQPYTDQTLSHTPGWLLHSPDGPTIYKAFGFKVDILAAAWKHTCTSG